MNKQNQDGSAHVIIISVVVLIIIGAIGYVFWNNFIAHKKSEDTAQVPSSSNTQASPKPVTDTGQLRVAAWNVTFSMPDALKNTSVKYYERTSSDTPPVTYYAFTTQRIQDLGGRCASQPLGDTVILNRFTEDQPAYPDSYWVSPEKIDGYRYVLSGPAASCSGGTSDDQTTTETSQTETNDKQSLIELVKSMVSAK